MKFSIRDVLWLTALVGMGLGWWVFIADWKRAKNENYYLKRCIWEAGLEPEWPETFKTYKLVPRKK